MSAVAEIQLTESEAFLGVDRSLTGRYWRRRDADETVVRDHMLRLTLSEPLAREGLAVCEAIKRGQTP